MAKDPRRLPAARCWSHCAAIPVLVTAFVGLGDLQASMHPGPTSVTMVAENTLGQEPAKLASNPVTPAQDKPPTGNPLWAVPLSALSETIDRPLFSPSRRPPPPPVAAAPAPKRIAPPAKDPDHPLLTLLGTIVGPSESIGVFLDQASQGVVRLRTGQVHGGWTLRFVQGRAANFEKDHQGATLALPPPEGQQPAANVALDVAATEGAGIRGNAQPFGSPLANSARPVAPALPAAAQTKQTFRRTPREL